MTFSIIVTSLVFISLKDQKSPGGVVLQSEFGDEWLQAQSAKRKPQMEKCAAIPRPSFSPSSLVVSRAPPGSHYSSRSPRRPFSMQIR